MNKTLIAGAAGVVLVSGLGLGIAQTAQADTPTSASNSDASAPTGDATNGRHNGHDGRGGKGFDAAALATKLGLSETAVSDAVTAVRDQTQSTDRPSADATQAEKIAAREARQAKFGAALATELNLDETTVTDALAELQAEKEAARAADRTAALDQAVTDGTLTQAEADAVQKSIDAGILPHRDAGSGRR
ncbi:MAG: hypothetical protein ACOH10_08320 [Rhodoglobus sp.]